MLMERFITAQILNWRKRLSNPRVRAAVVALLILLIVVPLWLLAASWYQARLLNEHRSRAALELSLRARALSAVLNRRLALLDGLEAFSQVAIQDENFKDNFATFAAGIYASAEETLNLAVAPGGVVNYVYPSENEVAVIGYDALQDPRPGVRADVQRAIETRAMVLSTPIKLFQGGIGVTARKAVYNGDTYWGLVSLVLKIDPLLERVGLVAGANGLELVMRDGTGRIIFGSADVLDQQPVLQRIELPDGYWELAGAPSGGWLAAVRNELAVFQATSLTIVLLIASLAYMMINRQSQLTGAVRQRTQEITRINEQLQLDIAERRRAENALREREAQYRSIFEAVRDGLFINRLDGVMVDFNPAAAEMHGYSIEEFRQLQPPQFVHPDSLHLFSEYINIVKEGGQFRSQAIDVRKDGTPFYVEVTGTQFVYHGQPHTLAVVRDVTERVEAYQLLEERVTERTREIAALLELNRNVTSTLELKPLLALVLSQLRTVVNYTGAGIAILEADEFVFLDYQGLAERDQILNTRIAPQMHTGYWTITRTLKPVIYRDVRDATSVTVSEEANGVLRGQFDYVRSWLGVPLLVKERLIGILRVDHVDPDHFDEQDAELVMAFASQAAVAIENARLYEQAQSLAALEERQKLARELHDSVSQALYGIALGSRTARALIDRDLVAKGDLIEPLDYVLSLAEAGLAEMRALIFELRPESLANEGLVAALNKQAEALRARHQVEVLTDICEEPALPLGIKEGIYRVAREALHNIMKHARATKIELKLACEPGRLTLTVKDNGAGFDPNTDFPGHLGLRSMRERIENLGGEIEILSAPGEGSLVRASLPIDG